MKNGACRTTLVWDRSVVVLGQPYEKVRAMSVFSIITLMVFFGRPPRPTRGTASHFTPDCRPPYD